MDLIIQTLAQELGRSPQQVENVVRLIDEGATIPFIARYRKELHGSMDDQLLRQLAQRLQYLRNLDQRRGEVKTAIENQGKLTPELSAAIDAAADKGVCIVVVDSAVNSSKVSAYVGADNYGAGQMAAKSALENVEGPLHVGLVNYNVNSPNAQEREEGVIDTLTASGRAEVAATVYSVATPESARAETLTMLARHPEINVLISFNEAVSVGAAQAVSDSNRADDLWMVAFDSNITTVDALHTGAVDAMVVQNTYGMGYFSVENAYKLLAGQGSDVTRETETATRIIDRSNIFALDGQKAVFPFE